MDMAERVAQQSSATRLKCGVIIVTNSGDGAIFIGYNGTPTGWDNICENEEWDSNGFKRLKTKPEVLHAEMNALTKVARSTLSCEGAVLFTTHSPCIECAKAIYQSGIREVYYKHKYRIEDGIIFLRKCGVSINELGVSGSGN